MIPLPLKVDWSEPYVEEWSWLTEVIESDSGVEQRRALRLKPRHSITFRTTDFEGRDRLRRQQAAKLSDLLIMPDEIRRTTTAAPAAESASTIQVAAAPWLTSAEWIVLTVDGSAFALEVASVSGAILTLVDPLTFPVPAGSTVRLGLLSRLEPKQTADMRSNEISQGTLKVEVEPGREVQVDSAAPVTFNGREVMLHRPDWSQPIAIEFEDSQTYVDGDVGVRVPYRRREWTRETIRGQHIIRSSADTQAVIDAFHRARGRQGDFYRPSWLNDFPLRDAVASGSKFWFTLGRGFAEAYAQSTVYRAIAVVMKGGVVHLLRIADVTAGGTSEPWSMIETVEGAPTAINPADVSMICLMPVVRFASDSLSVQWLTHTLARVQVSVTTLEDL